MRCRNCTIYKEEIEMILIHIFSLENGKEEILYQCPVCKMVGVEVGK